MCVVVLLAAALTPQAAPEAQAAPHSPPSSPVAVLIAEASNANSQAGSLQYAKHLTRMFVMPQTGPAFLAQFTRRLAAADLAARQGKHRWVPESAVAQAFNDFMQRISPGTALHTDAATVHRLRVTLAAVSPELSAVASHPVDCLPSEAIDVMLQLVSHNGQAEPSAQNPLPLGASAVALLGRYARTHTTAGNAAAYESIAQLFGF